MSCPLRHRRIALVLISCWFACLVSCGYSPKVAYTRIDSQAWTIQNWRVKIDNELTVLGHQGLAFQEIQEQEKARAAEYAYNYVRKIKTNLSKQKVMNFFDNPPFDGLMIVYMRGLVRLAPTEGQSKYYARNPERETPEALQRTKSMDTLVVLTVDLRSRVTYVRVTLMNDSGKQIGEVIIDDEIERMTKHTRSVSPEQVAKAISDAIKDSRRKERSG